MALLEVLMVCQGALHMEKHGAPGDAGRRKRLRRVTGGHGKPSTPCDVRLGCRDSWHGTLNADDLEEEIVEDLGHVGCSGAACVRSASVNESRRKLWMFGFGSWKKSWRARGSSLGSAGRNARRSRS